MIGKLNYEGPKSSPVCILRRHPLHEVISWLISCSFLWNLQEPAVKDWRRSSLWQFYKCQSILLNSFNKMLVFWEGEGGNHWKPISLSLKGQHESCENWIVYTGKRTAARNLSHCDFCYTMPTFALACMLALVTYWHVWAFLFQFCILSFLIVSFWECCKVLLLGICL